MEENNKVLSGFRERDVEKLASQLSDARRELEALSYSISHDLRAPLRTVFGFSQLLMKKYGNNLEGQAVEYIKRINSGAERMERMIEDLLTLSRVGRAEMNIEKVDVSSLVDSLISELRADSPERAVDVQVEQGVSVPGDPNLLRTALFHLVQNAWKFTEKTGAAKVRFYVQNVNELRWYCISDNGAGFMMNQVDRLFNPFQRLHLESEFPGTGIGLALVKKIIQRHHGSVRAEGAENEGAVFCFTLGLGEALTPVGNR